MSAAASSVAAQAVTEDDDNSQESIAEEEGENEAPRRVKLPTSDELARAHAELVKMKADIDAKYVRGRKPKHPQAVMNYINKFGLRNVMFGKLPSGHDYLCLRGLAAADEQNKWDTKYQARGHIHH